ncbi:MAG: glycosyltransferase [Anaerolineae bacterium]|nr:glycosyltransferase [Anaerolineae bacterium]
MRILMFTQSFPNRRYPIDSEFLVPVAAAWAEMGHQVRVLTVRYGEQDPLFEERDGFQISRFPFSCPRYEEQGGKLDAVWYMVEFLIKGGMNLYRQVQTFQPDVIDFEFVVPGALLSVPLRGLLRRRRIRKLIRICGSDYRVPRSVPFLGKLLLRFALRDFETIHFGTPDLIELAQTDGLLHHNLLLNFQGVPIDLYKPDPVLRDSRRAEMGLADKFVLLNVGRCIALKEQHLIIRALPLLQQHIPNIHFVLAGDGPEWPHLHRLAAEVGVSNRVTLLGAVEHSRLNEILNVADVFVSPHYGEWFPSLTIFEAAACGLPVIANFKPQYLTPYGLVEKEHLLRFGAEDVSNLARQVLFVFRHPEQAERMAEAFKILVRQRFSVLQMARAYLGAAK